jgi:hypothetical protein
MSVAVSKYQPQAADFPGRGCVQQLTSAEINGTCFLSETTKFLTANWSGTSFVSDDLASADQANYLECFNFDCDLA